MDTDDRRFQLIKGSGDWLRCQEDGLPAGALVHVSWDNDAQWLTLKPLLSVFPRRASDLPLDPSARRGAAADRFGNWYWIGNDRQRIFWQPSGSGRAQVYWTQAKAAPLPADDFTPVAPQAPLVAALVGLAVTEHHYLVVGNLTQPGLFLFDLHSGGEPLLMLFPAESTFEPLDMAPAPGGGLWILDRARRYWGLDREFRVVAGPAKGGGLLLDGETLPFHPEGDAPIARPGRQVPEAFPLDVPDPISIEGLPDGSVLILCRPGLPSPADPSGQAGTIYRYHYGQKLWGPVPLVAEAEIGIAGSEVTTTRLSVAGHDFAYNSHDHTLYVAERAGKQTIAFSLDLDSSLSPPGALSVKRDYLPMHAFGGRALVIHDHKVFYDVVGGAVGQDSAVRWVQLQTVDQPRYDRAAALLTPIFDGKARDCVWDRLFLDACIPPNTAVTISTRAQNDPALLDSAPFVAEPGLYLRGAGAEVPYYDPFPDLHPRAEQVGTWELLFQKATGRYLQIKLELSGNGRVSPQLRALRAYYPRFSYPKHYLPAVYSDDEESAWFLERLLANPQGFFIDLERKMTDVSVLFDPRGAPPETLNWLAGWLGLVLDPLWASIQERRQPSGQAWKPAPDRRRLFIRYAFRLYNQRGTPDGVKFALYLLLDPCLEARLERFKRAAVEPDPALRAELQRMGLSYPTQVMPDEAFEDLLHDYLLAPDRPTKVRLVERFLAREGRAAVAGDPTRAREAASTHDSVQASAHRFSVLVPEALSPEEALMVERIVGLEKPAHTKFDVRRYWDYFRVGEARLGIDTQLGEDSRFVPVIIGSNYLAEGYLSPSYPMDSDERVIADRDRLGTMPPL